MHFRCTVHFTDAAGGCHASDISLLNCRSEDDARQRARQRFGFETRNLRWSIEYIELAPLLIKEHPNHPPGE